jgi:hypothetical protein
MIQNCSGTMKCIKYCFRLKGVQSQGRDGPGTNDWAVALQFKGHLA